MLSKSFILFLCADGELMMSLSELCGDECTQQLFECPFSFRPMDDPQLPGSGICLIQLQSQPSAQSPEWAAPSHHDDHGLLNSCFYQLHMRGGPLFSEGSDCDPAGGGTHAPCGLQVEFGLPSTSTSSTAVLSSHSQVFGSLLHP